MCQRISEDGLSQTRFLRTVRQKDTTIREYRSPAASAKASSCGVGSRCSRRTSDTLLVFAVLLDDGKRRTSHKSGGLSPGLQAWACAARYLVKAAEARGQRTIQRSGVVVTMPFLTWPGGQR